jgi:hypothetical protein
MKLNKVVFLVLISLVFSLFISAQVLVSTENSSEIIPENETQYLKETTKVDEFGKVGDCDLGARLQNIRDTELQLETSKLYIILYQGINILPSEFGKNGQKNRILHQMAFLGLDETRVFIVDGGFRKELLTELWIAPLGAKPPEPTDTLPKPEIPKNKTFLFDKTSLHDTDFSEFELASVVAKRLEEERAEEEETRQREEEEKANQPNETDTQTQAEASSDAENLEESAEFSDEFKVEEFYWINKGFGEILQKQKGSNGVMIFYTDDEYYDVYKIQSFIESGKRHIAKEFEVSSHKIEVIYGGYRDNTEIEFWIVPKSGKQPTLSPRERPIPETTTEVINN